MTAVVHCSPAATLTPPRYQTPGSRHGVGANDGHRTQFGQVTAGRAGSTRPSVPRSLQGLPAFRGDNVLNTVAAAEYGQNGDTTAQVQVETKTRRRELRGV